MSDPKHDPYIALRQPEFRWYVTAKLLITIYVQIQSVVVGWQLYELTNDVFSLGLVGLIEAVPALSVSLFAGYVADHYNRRRIVQYCYILMLISVSILFLFAYKQAEILPVLGVFPIYIAVFLNGLARGFASPSSFALMTQLVPKEAYINSSSWNSTIWQFGAISGPAIGGLLYGFAGAVAAYSTAASLVIIAFIALLFIKNRPLPPPKSADITIWQSISEGLTYVRHQPIILSAISLDLFAVLFGGAVALLPVFAKDILHVGAEGLGLLRAAPAVGAGIMAFVLAYQPPMQYAGRNLLWAVAGFGLATIVFAVSANFYLSLVALFMIGLFDSISVVIRTTIMQLYTPDDMRGRVSAVNSMFIGSSNEIGAFESGAAAALLGTVPSVIFGGAMTLLVVAVAYYKAPTLKKLSFKDEVIK